MEYMLFLDHELAASRKRTGHHHTPSGITVKIRTCGADSADQLWFQIKGRFLFCFLLLYKSILLMI